MRCLNCGINEKCGLKNFAEQKRKEKREKQNVK